MVYAIDCSKTSKAWTQRISISNLFYHADTTSLLVLRTSACTCARKMNLWPWCYDNMHLSSVFAMFLSRYFFLSNLIQLTSIQFVFVVNIWSSYFMLCKTLIFGLSVKNFSCKGVLRLLINHRFKKGHFFFFLVDVLVYFMLLSHYPLRSAVKTQRKD